MTELGSILPPPLLDAGARCGRLLSDRGATVAVGEGSCGGLVSAALLAVPGASAYYRGGGVIYTGAALVGMLSGRVEPPDPLRGATESWALHLARAARITPTTTAPLRAVAARRTPPFHRSPSPARPNPSCRPTFRPGYRAALSCRPTKCA